MWFPTSASPKLTSDSPNCGAWRRASSRVVMRSYCPQGVRAARSGVRSRGQDTRRCRPALLGATSEPSSTTFGATSRFLAAVTRTCDVLAHLPGMGSFVESDLPALDGLRWMRVRRFRKYLILYEPLADGIEVKRVVPANRDIERALDD